MSPCVLSTAAVVTDETVMWPLGEGEGCLMGIVRACLAHVNYRPFR